MIEGISVVTLGTHEMPRAVRFYRALGFELLHGREESAQSGRTCGSPTQALDFLVFECCPWRVPEADRQPVVGIHQADRDREID
jgi:catechol 2,3-dioxygenase-like lactoylglutathione lyase family enzyme